MKAPLLEVRNLGKSYRFYRKETDRLKEIFTGRKLHRVFEANRNISFDLHAGETLGIIGVNGAGKSTLLKMIAGVIEPSEGTILRRGHVTALLELGTGFNQELSGRENIFFNGMLIGMERSALEERLEEIIAFSELGAFIDEPIKTYSSGMLMRLAFSIAIHSDPRILIVDEALSVGDAHFGAKCTRALKELKEHQMGIIYVSHDLNSLKLLCDRLILLDAGRIVDEGDPEKVVNHYNYRIAQLNESDGGEVRRIEPDLHGTGEVEIRRVVLLGSESFSDVLRSGETMRIAVDLYAHEDFDDLSMGIMIRDRYGQDLYGTRSFDHVGAMAMRSGERRRVVYTMAANLGPGAYTLSVAVHSDVEGANRRLGWKDRAAAFEVAGILGPKFHGLCRLEPRLTWREPRRRGTVLVTTSRSLLLVDLETARSAPVHRGMGLYYGLCTDGTSLYVAARRRMVSQSEPSPEEERGCILRFDRHLRLIERLEAPFPLRDLHQIRFIDGKLYATCSYDDMVAVYDGREWERWYPAGEGGSDRHHFNSLLPLENGGISVLAHNFGVSEIWSFDRAHRLTGRKSVGRCAHNLWRREGRFCTLSSEESRMVDEEGATLLPLEGFPRGIASFDGGVAVGISERAERAKRDFVDAKLLLFDREWLPLETVLLAEEGMILDLLRTDGRCDPFGAEGFAVERDAIEAFFAASQRSEEGESNDAAKR